MNGDSGSPHGPLDTILMSLGELKGGQNIVIQLVQEGFREQHHINRVVAEDVAQLKESIPQKSESRTLWKDLPLKELALLSIIALSGLLQILHPTEVKEAIRSAVMRSSGGEK